MSDRFKKKDRHYTKAREHRPFKHKAAQDALKRNTPYPKFTCTYCGKQVFDSRKEVRTYYKMRFPGEPNFRAYICRQAPEGIVYWHYGHNKPESDRGKKS